MGRRERNLVLFPDVTIYKKIGEIRSSINRLLRFVCRGKFKVMLWEDSLLKKPRLRDCRTIIAVCIGGVGPFEVIQLVHRLRGDFGWEGGFLAIVEDNTEREELLALSVLGDREGRFRFGKLPGHVALCLPLLLIDLLRTVQTMEEMSLEVWHSLLDQTSLGRILEKLGEAEKMVERPMTNDRIRVATELLGEMEQIDWLSLLLDSHKDMRLVTDLLDAYPPGYSFEEKDCVSIVTRIREIVLRTTVGAPHDT